MPNATLDQLAPRGPIQAGDLLPILPNGGGSLQNVAAAGIKSFVLAGSGAQTGLLVLTPSGDPTGAADTTAINSALATGNDVSLAEHARWALNRLGVFYGSPQDPPLRVVPPPCQG